MLLARSIVWYDRNIAVRRYYTFSYFASYYLLFGFLYMSLESVPVTERGRSAWNEHGEIDEETWQGNPLPWWMTLLSHFFLRANLYVVMALNAPFSFYSFSALNTCKDFDKHARSCHIFLCVVFVVAVVFDDPCIFETMYQEKFWPFLSFFARAGAVETNLSPSILSCPEK